MIPSAKQEQVKEFWERLEDCRSGMLSIDGRAVPMSHYIDTNKRELWFLSAKDTYMAEHADGTEARYMVCNDDEGLYADISGRLTPETNPQKVDEYWNFVAASWYEDGKRDPDLQLLKLSLKDGEIWTAKGGAGFMFQVAKANVTGEKPDIGDHYEIHFG